MNHQQARLEAILQDLASSAVDYGGDIEAVVPLDTLTELAGLGYDTRALGRDIHRIIHP